MGPCRRVPTVPSMGSATMSPGSSPARAWGGRALGGGQGKGCRGRLRESGLVQGIQAGGVQGGTLATTRLKGVLECWDTTTAGYCFTILLVCLRVRGGSNGRGLSLVPP